MLIILGAGSETIDAQMTLERARELGEQIATLVREVKMLADQGQISENALDRIVDLVEPVVLMLGQVGVSLGRLHGPANGGA